MDKTSIIELLKAIGFELVSGLNGVWSKKYPSHDNYIINIDLSKPSLTDCKILYGQKIVIGRNTTTNFSQKENLVVLSASTVFWKKDTNPKV